MKVFVSYRRGICEPLVQLIADRLKSEGHKLFLDHHSVAPGDIFAEKIRSAIADSDAFLAMIGPDWSREQAIRSSDDWVRREIEWALQRSDLLILPVLLLNAQLPEANELPPELAPLVDRHALRVESGASFELQLQQLIRALDPGADKRKAVRIALASLLAMAALAALAATWSRRRVDPQRAAPSTPAEVESAPFVLQNRATANCVVYDQPDPNNNDMARLALGPCGGSRLWHWRATTDKASGAWHLTSVESERHCLDGIAGSVYAFLCNRGGYQQWYAEQQTDSVRLQQNVGERLCLEAQRDGLDLRPCNGSARQQWSGWRAP
jgi:hypothetical protein